MANEENDLDDFDLDDDFDEDMADEMELDMGDFDIDDEPQKANENEGEKVDQ